MRKLFGYFIASCVLSASAFAQGPAIKMTGPMGVQGNAAILGWYPVVLSDADRTLTAPEYASNFLLVTSSVPLTAARNLVGPLTPGQQFTIENKTTGGQNITIGGATGAKITIAPGQTQSVTCDGVNYIQPPGISGVGTGYAYGNGAAPFSYSPTIPYSALSGAPVYTQFYQTVQVSGSPQTQEPKLNLLPAVAGSVSSSTVTAGGSAYVGAPSVAFSGGGCAVEPTGSSIVTAGVVTSVVMVTSGSGCTSAPSIVFSGGGGSGAAATAVLAPDGISCVDNPLNGSTDCLIPSGGSGSGAAITQNDVTATRALATTYQNTTTGTLYEFGYGSTTGGATGSIVCYDGTTSSLGSTPFGGSSTATINSGMASFSCFIPPGYYYEVVASGAVNAIGKWYEDSGFGGGSGGSGAVGSVFGRTGAVVASSTDYSAFYLALGGNAATASALAATPTVCPSGQVPTGILANGDATGCAAPAGGASPGGTAGAMQYYLSSTALGGLNGSGIPYLNGASAPTIATTAQTTLTINSTACVLGGSCTIPSGGSGTVTSFGVGAWPSWLTPTVTNATTTPSIAVAASAIPNAALANDAVTVNSIPCTLGGTCTITAPPPEAWSYYSFAAEDGGTASAAAFLRYDNNQPQAGSVAPATTTEAYMLFQATPTLPQYLEDAGLTVPPYWTGTDLFVAWYSTATTGNAVIDVQTACVLNGSAAGTIAYSSPVTITQAVSGTAGLLMLTPVQTNILLPASTGCTGSGSTTPTRIAVRVYMDATSAVPVYGLGAELGTKRSQ